jgi:LmbE family N-acetylglucosaminyl deacetylase
MLFAVAILQAETMMSKAVLALVPHPDDAEFYAGGLLARLAAEGARVHIVVATDGRRGSFEADSAVLSVVRAEEMRRAAAALGANPPILLGYLDGELDTLPAGVLRERFIRAIRLFRPDVVVAQDPYAPFEPHPDHRAVAWAATEALNFARLPLYHPEHLAEGLTPHLVVEKYFYANVPALANKCVDIGDHLQRKIAALAEHRSQVAFLVAGVLAEAEAAGLNPRAMFGEGTDDPATLLAWAMQVEAAKAGQGFGVQYGEVYRFERFTPLVESVLAQAAASQVR